MVLGRVIALSEEADPEGTAPRGYAAARHAYVWEMCTELG
jgi:hypothetical protein